MSENTETKFGFDQLNTRTPLWAKRTFYIVSVLTTVAVFIVSGDPAIKPDTAVRIMLYLKGLDMLTLALSKMFGLQTKDEQS
ncbi:hypothetical protein [Chitinophaga sp.]|uniref:hypothetical protein n=1 Tax=Chitinophaga sp. TaxID=1869181 RepID=UPI0031D73256